VLKGFRFSRDLAVWTVALAVIAFAIGVAARSPLLAWREPIYIIAGFAGIIAMGLLLVQPLLASRSTLTMTQARKRRLHRWVGGALVFAVVIHVVGLWITSPPDVIDALLFTSPTPFSAWGVIAMWAVFAAAGMAAFRKRLSLRLRTWRMLHTCFVFIVVVGSAVHAALILGTMGIISKALLCLLAVLALVKTVWELKCWVGRR
jgi:predicted ferric reductase